MSEARVKDVDGILVLDKPRGPTSSFVVQRIRRLLEIDKIGHTGTLDPMATGVLPLCLGKATALAGFLTGEDKRYLARLRLGARTDSGDAEGKVIEERAIPELRESDVRTALDAMVGTQQQTPPMVSAVKVDGRRLYELARKGQEVERVSREIRILAMELRELATPDLEFEVHCSKGTYVRVLGEDLAGRLGTVGHLVALRRLSSGSFDLTAALQLDQLENADADDRREVLVRNLIPMERAIAGVPRLTLTAAEVAGIAHGRRPRARPGGPQALIALMDDNGKLLALAAQDGQGAFSLTRVLVQPS